MSKFNGFPDDTPRFLSDLGEHNEKAWFDANRSRYEHAFVAPARRFVSSMAEVFPRFAPDVQADARVNGSIFRINRDIRFSADKTPYKDHLDLWFWSESRNRGAGFFLRLTSDTVHLGAGCHAFDKDGLDAYRRAVLDEATAAPLVALIADLERQGYTIGGEHYKRVPRGMPADHPQGRWLRHNALYAHYESGFEEFSVHSAAFVAQVTEHFERLQPLQRWLSAVL